MTRKKQGALQTKLLSGLIIRRVSSPAIRQYPLFAEMKKDGQRESATANISDWRRVFLTSVADFSLERLIIWSECQWQVLRAQGDVWNSSLGPTNSPKPKDIQFTVRPQRKQQISGMFGRFTGFKLPFHYHNCLFEQYSHLRSWKHCFVLLFVIGSVLDVPLKAAVQPLLELDRV